MFLNIRMLRYRIGENGIFVVWGNDQCINHSGPRDILSFTYNWNVYHVHLEIKSMPSEYEQSPCKNNLHFLEIGSKFHLNSCIRRTVIYESCSVFSLSFCFFFSNRWHRSDIFINQ